MMYEAPELWHELMVKLTGQLASYLQLQISAGVEAVQLFIPGSATYRFTIIAPMLSRT